MVPQPFCSSSPTLNSPLFLSVFPSPSFSLCYYVGDFLFFPACSDPSICCLLLPHFLLAVQFASYPHYLYLPYCLLLLSKGPGHFSDLLDTSCSVVIYCSVYHSACSCCFIWLFLSAAAQFADCSHFSPFPIYYQFSHLLTHCLSPPTLITQLLTSTYCCCFFLLLLIPCTSYLSSLTHSHKYCHTLPSLTHASNAHAYFLPASLDFLLSLLYLPKPLPFFTVLFTFCPPWLFSVLILPSQECFAIATFPHTVQPLFPFAFAACFHHFP